MLEILDCTLRDGGHVIGCNFGRNVITDVVSALNKSNCDIIELGFLMDKPYNKDYSIFNNCKQAEQFIPNDSQCEYSLLTQQDQYDTDLLEDCNGKIKNIRVSFHTYDKKEGFICAKKIKDKGYNLHINPINFTGYTYDEMLDMIDNVNKIHPHTFSIVDTFGSLLLPQLKEISSLLEKNLDKDIAVGLHLHENLSSSFVLAQAFILENKDKRDISVDASIDGMGKIPGNMPIELIMDFANKYLDKDYNISALTDVNTKHLQPIKNKFRWGYSLPFAFAAEKNIHRSYAAYAVDNQATLSEVYSFLKALSEDKKSIYDKNYAEMMFKKVV